MVAEKRLTDVLTEWTGVFMRRSSRDFNRFMKESGLSMPQISVLMMLYYRHTCGVTDLSGYTGVTNAAASQMVDRLVQFGLLERREDVQDRRVKHVTLTDKGRDLVEEVMEARRKWMENLTAALSAEDQEMIICALTALTEAARKVD